MVRQIFKQRVLQGVVQQLNTEGGQGAAEMSFDPIEAGAEFACEFELLLQVASWMLTDCRSQDGHTAACIMF